MVTSRDDVVHGLRGHLDGALLALDFDGTLAPIVTDPETSRPADGARAALDALVARGARVAVVTGREAEVVLRLSGLADLPGLTVEGLYGMQEWYDGTLHSPDAPPSITALRPRLTRLVDRDAGGPGVWVEDKTLSLVVHARTAAHPDEAMAPLLQPVRDLAGELGLEVHPGRQVLELRVPGYDKGAAVRRLVERHAPGALLVAGDDLGDIDAFRAARGLNRDTGLPAWTVGIGHDVAQIADEVDLLLADPAAFVALLDQVGRD